MILEFIYSYPSFSTLNFLTSIFPYKIKGLKVIDGTDLLGNG